MAIVPLAMPLLAGPGSIATVVVLMGRTEGHRLVARRLPVLGAIALVAVAAYLAMTGGHAGRTGCSAGPGSHILERAAGLLLAAIAIQFMIDGLSEALPGLTRGG